MCNFDRENIYLQKSNLVNVNKSSWGIPTFDLCLTSLILQPLSYGDIQPKRLIETIIFIKQNI